MVIDWDALTVEKAKRLVGAANRQEQKMAAIFNEASDEEYDEAEANWRKAFDDWENLNVFIHCGKKPGEH